MESMKYFEERLELLALVHQNVQQDSNFTFIEIDRLLDDKNLNEEPINFLYRTNGKAEIIWAFHKKRNLDIVNDLFKRNVLDIVETDNVEYGKRDVKEDKSLANKLSFLLKTESWIPTHIVKGKRFKKEWERLNNVTS